MNIQFSAANSATHFGTDSRTARRTAALINRFRRHIPEGGIVVGGHKVIKDAQSVTIFPVKDSPSNVSLKLRPSRCGTTDELFVGSGEMPTQGTDSLIVGAVYDPKGTLTGLSKRSHSSSLRGGVVCGGGSIDCEMSREGANALAKRIPLETILGGLRQIIKSNKEHRRS